MFLEVDAEKDERSYLYKRNQGFKRSERLKKRNSFNRLFKEGRYFKTADFSLRVLTNNLNISKLGISVQTKVFPKAVQRNRLKRLIREVFRRNKNNLNNGYDIIISPKNLGLFRLGYNQIEEKVLGLFKTAGLIKEL